MNLTPMTAPEVDKILAQQSPIVEAQQYCESKLITVNTSVNPLVAAATPIISLMNRLCYRANHKTQIHEGIDQDIWHELKAFESQLWQQQVPAAQIYAGRIFLCAWIDEVMSHPDQPLAHIWKKRPLAQHINLSEPIHPLALSILEQATQDPEQQLPLLELIYLCLSMGYTSLFHRQAHPQQMATACKNKVYRLIRQYRDGTPTTTMPIAHLNHTTDASTQKPHHLAILLTSCIALLITLNIILSQTTLGPLLF